MTVIDVTSLNVIERLPGWRGLYLHSQNMTFAHYDFDKGATIHEHSHSDEEGYDDRSESMRNAGKVPR